ncbi:MAG TPA: hypothetical protein VLC79_06635 [Cellvibrio sp.]|nr:hypothetical protein [Cellvibrio sp.]
MTPAQKKIIHKWLWLLAFLLLCTFVYIYPFKNTQVAFFVIVGPVYMLLMSNKSIRESAKGYGTNSLRLPEYLEENPRLKYWMVCFSAIFLPIVIYKLYQSGGESYSLMAVAIVGLIVPPIVLSEIQNFKEAGKDA